MNKFQILMNDLEKWYEQSEDYMIYARKIKQEVNEIEKVLNDFRHLRENFEIHEVPLHALEKLDLRERELLQRRREIKTELLHYEKCRALFESIQKQTKELLKPSYHHYQTTYQVKTKEGDTWFQLLNEQGFESTIQINPFQKSKVNVPVEEDFQEPLDGFFGEKQEPMQLHINHTKKSWIAHDINCNLNVYKAKKLGDLLKQLPANAEILKMPKSITKFIQDFKQQQVKCK